MFFPTSTVGRKIIMAITGQILVLFILFHIAGNSTIFFHQLNAYVVGLYGLPVLVWGGRVVLAVAFVLHIWYGTMLKLENNAAKPLSYAVTRYREATAAGRSQFWTGVVIAAFVAYHLLQFTFQVIDPRIAADTHPDALGRPDVFTMVVKSFRQIGVSGFYVISLAALGLHLLHGMQSSIQTWGLNNERTLPAVEKAGAVTSAVLFAWYTAIPVAIVAGILRG